MKAVYIGNYCESSGYSKAALEYILSLDEVGVEVVPRHVSMTGNKAEVPARIKELEQNDTNNVDVVFQHNLPSEFAHKGGVLNIGVFSYETNHFRNTNWASHLSLMDKVIVSCEEQKYAIKNSMDYRTVPNIDILPFAVDTSKYFKDYDLMNFDTPKSTVKFYTIAELGKRKNLSAILAAYYAAFDSADDVLLIVKVSSPSRDAEKTSNLIGDMCKTIKGGMNRGKNSFPKVALITDYLSDSEINSLHCTGDVYVNASHAESFCIPFIDALGFGKPTIVPFNSSFIDYATRTDSVTVETNESVVFGVENAPPGLYTSDEIWKTPSLSELRRNMWFVKNNIDSYRTKEQAESRRNFVVENMSRGVIGNKLKEIINAK